MTRFISNYSGAESVADLVELEDAILMAGVSAVSTESYGITAFGGPHRIGVFGTLGASINAISVLSGASVTLKVGGQGQIIGGLDAVLIYGGGTRIENFGQITSMAGRGIGLVGGAVTVAAAPKAPVVPTDGPGTSAADPVLVRNHGTIAGEIGIGVTGLAATIVNKGEITGLDGKAIAADLGNIALKNYGALTGDVVLGTGLDTVLNRGKIHGDLLTGDGADQVDNRGGLIDGAIDLGLGTDKFIGGTSDESVAGGASGDMLDGRGGDDLLDGGAGKDTLLGGDGSDILLGGTGADVLKGGAGDDALTGGGAADDIYGGSGADRFIYDQASVGADSIDKIFDFSRAQGDKIDLAGVDAVKATAGDQAFKFIGTQAFHKIAGELRYEASGLYASVQADTDGNGFVDLVIFVYPGGTLEAGDFIL